MLMQAQPVYDAWKAACEEIGSRQPEAAGQTGAHGVCDAAGAVFNQQMAKRSSRRRKILFSCAGTMRGSTSVY